MKNNYSWVNFRLLTACFLGLMSTGMGQIISQYIDTNSGTSPKGIEVWNNTGSTLDFGTNNLIVQKGTNGGALSTDYTLSSGTLASGDVIVIGTSDMQATTESNGATFYLKAFSFNGDDALAITYGGVTTDVFGNPGSDPGSEWSGNGVSTADQNISLLSSISTGDTDGWTDPSTRFETTTSDNSLTGFGIAPGSTTPSITVSKSTLPNFTYVVSNGPSSEQNFSVSGSNLSADIIITPPTNYEISTGTGGSFSATNPITFHQSSGSVSVTTIYVRLKSGLSEGTYDNENITAASTGATDKTVACSGNVTATSAISPTNGNVFISEVSDGPNTGT